MAYTVIRTDLMSGTDVRTDVVSVKVADTAVENGTIVALGGYADNQREVYTGTLATAATAIANCVVIASPEVMYDERKKNLDEFINEKGAIMRGYALKSGCIYSVTAGAFAGDVPTAANTEVKLGASGKITTEGSGTALGKVMAIETAGRYTYYVIKIA